jgi:hypothetical protein
MIDMGRLCLLELPPETCKTDKTGTDKEQTGRFGDRGTFNVECYAAAGIVY